MDKRKKSDELIIAYKELAYHNKEKGKRTAELFIATFLGDYSAYRPFGEKKMQNTILFSNHVAIAFAGCSN